MEKEDLKKLKEQLSKLTEDEQKERDLYLRELATGEVQGPPVGYASIDKPWLSNFSTSNIKSVLPDKTLYEYLLENNIDNLDDIALDYFGRKITYRQLISNIDKVANQLLELGVKEGDIVSISTPTLPETIYLFYAISKIGAVSNMIDPRTSSEGIKDYVNEAKSKYLFMVDVASGKISDIMNTTSVEKVITISPADSLPMLLNLAYKGKSVLSGKNVNKDFLTWKKFCDYKSNRQIEKVYPEYNRNRPVAIVHTGGTTGKAKGVLLSNYSLNAAAHQCRYCGFDFKEKDKWLNIMPPFIAYGIGNGLHLPLICGMEVVLIPQFDPKKFDQLLIKHKPNHMVGVPSHYENIIHSKKMKDFDLSFLKSAIVGGDKMDEALEEETNEFFEHHNCHNKISKGYGMTEVNAAVAATCASDVRNEIGSVGFPFVNETISVFNPETNEELGYNEIGEIRITGPNSMLGYYKNQEETDKVIKKDIDGKEWVHSGDLGRITANGNIYIMDRIKRMIIRHDGFKVFPSAIEKVISENSDVKTCSVIGKPDISHVQGKLPHAYVVLREGASDSDTVKSEIANLCHEKLAEYSQPEEIEFIDTLPLTPIGKVDYRALEEKAKVKQLKR